jgi:hypothetical protein
MAAIPSAILISNLVAAQQSLDMAKQAHKNWMERNEKNKDELQQVLARKAALDEEAIKREHDVAEGTKNLQVAWAKTQEPASQEPAPLPVSASPKRLTKSSKILTQEERQSMTQEEADAFLVGRMSTAEVASLSKEDKKRRKELKKAASEERKASRSPEEQAKIDAQVAKMQAGRVQKASPSRSSEEPPALVGGASV